VRHLIRLAFPLILFGTISCGGSGSASSLTAPTSTFPSTPATTGCGSSTQGSMSATVDGVPWSTNCVDAVQDPCNGYAITGAGTTGDATPVFGVMIVIPDPGHIGTFPFYSGGIILPSGEDSMISPSGGTVTFTTYTSTHIVGTFAFTTTPSRVVTGTPSSGNHTVTAGKFNVTFAK